MSTLESIVVVGASLAGLRAAETLRAEGFAGTITVVGDEPAPPYDRPPLSKQVLPGEWDADRIALPAGSNEALDLTWELGVRRCRASISASRRLHWPTVATLGFDGLVLACGAAPRMIPGTEGMAGRPRAADPRRRPGRARRHRGRRSARGRGRGRVHRRRGGGVVPRLGVDVTLVEPLPAPLARVLGPEMGGVVAELHGTTASTSALARRRRHRWRRGRCRGRPHRRHGGRGRPGRRRHRRDPQHGLARGQRAHDRRRHRVRRDHARRPGGGGVRRRGPLAQRPLRRGHAGRALGARARHGRARGPAPARRRRPGEPSARCRSSGATSTTARSNWPAGSAPPIRSTWWPGRIEERRFCALYGRDGRVVRGPRHEHARPGDPLPPPDRRGPDAGTTPCCGRGRAPGDLTREPGDWTMPIAAGSACGRSRVEVVDDDGAVLQVVTRAEMRRAAVAPSLHVHRGRRPRRAARGPPAGAVEGRVAGPLGPGLRRRRRRRRGLGRRALRELAEEAGRRRPALQAIGGGDLRRRRRLGARRVYLARHDGPFTFPDGEVAAGRPAPARRRGAWIAEHELCPDSVTLAARPSGYSRRPARLDGPLPARDGLVSALVHQPGSAMTTHRLGACWPHRWLRAHRLVGGLADAPRSATWPSRPRSSP